MGFASHRGKVELKAYALFVFSLDDRTRYGWLYDLAARAAHQLSDKEGWCYASAISTPGAGVASRAIRLVSVERVARGLLDGEILNEGMRLREAQHSVVRDFAYTLPVEELIPFVPKGEDIGRLVRKWRAFLRSLSLCADWDEAKILRAAQDRAVRDAVSDSNPPPRVRHKMLDALMDYRPELNRDPDLLRQIRLQIDGMTIPR